MKIMVKTTLKLLLRMKSFWFFLLVTPILSTLVMLTNENNLSYYENSATGEIAELNGAKTKVAYYGGKGRFVIKVYDAEKSSATGYVLEKIMGSGLFQVCRADISDMSETELDGFIKERVDADGNTDRMGAALFILPDFDEKLEEGNAEKALRLFSLSDDSRIKALESEIMTQLSRLDIAGNGESLTADEIVERAAKTDSVIPEKKVRSISTEKKQELSGEQIDQRTRMGYALAIMTLGYVFCGLFVAHVAISEQKDSVLTRIKLAGNSMTGYFASKIVSTFISTLLLTGVMAVCSLFIDVDSIGMSRVDFILIIAMMGLIFSILNMMLGVLIGDVMSSNVAAFTVWSMSGLLGGLYFPLDYTTDALKTISYLMPHKWFLDGTETVLTGDKTGLFMLLCVTVAFLVIIGSLGSLGLRIRRTDEWGNA